MNNLKRQYLPPGLWIVATPIGNLQDLSPRARQALEDAHAVLCEDTRRTAALMSAVGAPRDGLERFDAHSTPGQVRKIVERLGQGENLALVTDAGTPAVSDPGAALVAEARAAGIVITPIPGPSAPVALLSVAGFRATEFTFGGFFPRKPGERRELLKSCEKDGISRIFVWFESPQRISEALAAVAEAQPAARVIAGKELT
ncbi:MAG: SAM-dependent methyltransferase, partial [Bdellovibrionota bacterium]